MRSVALNFDTDHAITANGATHVIEWTAKQFGPSECFDIASPTILSPPAGASRGSIRGSLRVSIGNGSGGKILLSLLRNGVLCENAQAHVARYADDEAGAYIATAVFDDILSTDEFELAVLMTGAAGGVTAIAAQSHLYGEFA